MSYTKPIRYYRSRYGRRRRPHCSICGHTGHNRTSCRETRSYEYIYYYTRRYEEFLAWQIELERQKKQTLELELKLYKALWKIFKKPTPKPDWMTSLYPIWHPNNPKNSTNNINP